MRALAVISMHTSPLAQPGTGDGGGMNVYVRALGASLARAGVACDVYTRSWSADLPPLIEVEPGLRVHHVPAGPPAVLPKAQLPALVDEFTAGVLHRIRTGAPADVVHANYWLSGLAGHVVKHELDLPLVSTFHTLARVKAEGGTYEGEAEARAAAEALVIGCSDTVLASCSVEAVQLETLYDADPARIEIVPPGIEPAIFSPGDRAQARRAVGIPPGGPLLLYVGRIQPLKGVDVAVRALACLDDHPDARLVIVGGPSGPDGNAEVSRVQHLVRALGLTARVHFVPPQPHELLSSYYRAADVCLVPSRSESFGLVALEAAACGTPVVASAVGGLTTLVVDHVTGYLVEGRDAPAYAAAVSAVLADPVGAAAMGRDAARRAARYTWPAAAGRLRRIYAGLGARALVDCA